MTDSTSSVDRKSHAPQMIRMLLAAAVVLIPLALYIAHAAMLGRWVVDDAGISFAYARNIAQGYGFVAQPGMPPIEGYSNFLWTILWVPFFALKLFDPIWVVKIASIAFVAGSFFQIAQSLKSLRDGRVYALVILTLLALHPSFVIWTISGLENPLYVFLIATLFDLAMGITANRVAFTRHAVLAGVVTAAIAMTRPDGIVYVVLFPALTVIVWPKFARDHQWQMRALAGAYVLSFLVLFGGFLAFRWLTFGNLLPNTYYAKNGPGLGTVADLLLLRPITLIKLFDLMNGLFSHAGMLVLACLAVATLYLLFTGRFRPEHQVTFLFLMVAMAVFLLLPPDWMTEYRFATPFYMLFYVYAVMLMDVFLKRLHLPAQARRQYVGIVVGIIMVGSAVIGYRRTEYFAASPTLPLEAVVRSLSDPFDQYSAMLDVEDPSILSPDIGGLLFTGNIKVVDRAGLIDETISRTAGTDPGSYIHYIFDEIRPTFIYTHASWAYADRFWEVPRFQEDYVAICEATDQWAKSEFNEDIPSGYYVRRSAADGHESALAEIQARYDANCVLKSGS